MSPNTSLKLSWSLHCGGQFRRTALLRSRLSLPSARTVFHTRFCAPIGIGMVSILIFSGLECSVNEGISHDVYL